MNEEQIRNIIRDELSNFIQSDRYNFFRKIQMQDGRGIQTGRTNGTKIGESSDQKLSVYGVTPVIQQSKINDPTDAGATYLAATAQSSVDKIKEIINALEAFGITST